MSSKQTGSSAGVFTAVIYTGATGLSAGTSFSPLNSNFGSNKTLSTTATRGQEAATVTGGTAVGTFIFQEAQFINTELAWVIPKGSSIALTITPGASNTSMTITFVFEAHLSRV